MYRIKFLKEIDNSGMEPVKRFHTAKYGEMALEKRASHFASMGFKGVVSVERGEKAKKSVKEVLDLFYPDERIMDGTKITITDQDKVTKEAAIKASKGQSSEPTGSDDELTALRAEAKELGIKNTHVMKEAKLKEKIAELK